MNINKRNELNDLSSLCMNNQSLSFVEDRSFKKIFGKKFYSKVYTQNILEMEAAKLTVTAKQFNE